MPRKKRGKRIVFRVHPGEEKRWRIVCDGSLLASYDKKATAVKVARRMARKSHQVDGKLTQLVICGRDGRIQTEHTYGEDPRRHRG